MEKNKVQKISLTEEKETLLITLYAKALDYRSKKSILNDSIADKLVNKIEYDFEKVNSIANGNIIVVRARQIDEWLKEFLNINPNALVLNLGCGLDSRVSRINPSSNVSWFDVDYPDVIELRKNFYSNRDGYQMIESSVTELGWMDNIPVNEPVIIIAEGILEYIVEDGVKKILNRITEHFHNGQIVLDVMNSFAVKSARSKLKETTGAEHKWAVDDINEVDKLNLELKRTANLSVFGSKYINELPFKYRLLYRSMFAFSVFRNMMRLLKYNF
jgi:O-methyltransferase involved in polyketide biosynthesis